MIPGSDSKILGEGVMPEQRRRVMSGAAVFLYRGDKLILKKRLNSESV